MNFGVLVSLHSGIANHSKAGAIDISVLADGRFCIFISKFLAGEDPLHSLMSWKPFFEVFYELQKTAGAETTEALSKAEQDTVLQQRLQKAEEYRQLIIRLFKHHEEETRSLRNEFMNVKKSFDEGWVRLNAKITVAEQSIAGIIKTVLAGPTAVAEQEEPEVAAKKSRVELATHIFTKPDIQLYTVQQREFIDAVLSNFEITNEEAIQLQKKLFKDTVAAATGLSEDAVQRFCETVLSDGCWCKGKQKVRYLKVRA